MAHKENDVSLPVAAAAVELPVLPDANEGAVLDSINEKFIEDYHETKREKPCTIYKVRERIRKDDPEAYNPQVISIGPFHHANKLLLPMERLKRKFLGDLIKRHPSNTLANYIQKLSSAATVTEASNCYSEQVVNPENINAFVEMLVLDGCFIIEFLVKSFLGEPMGEVDFVNWNRSLIENDLLLLENQIPFFVLQSLFDSSAIPTINDGTNPVSLKELAASCISRDRQVNMQPIPEVVHHLLHLRHSSLLPGRREPSHEVYTKPRSSFFLRCWRPDPPEANHRAPRMTPSATELREAGIKFQIKRQSGGILDVSFRSKDGIMEIPLISVQAVTISQFRNLLAFEQCFPSAGSHFTSYVALMDNLIDIPADVAFLERSGVLESKLSCDEEVCRFFNSLGKGAYLDYEHHYLVGLFKDVKEYCSKRGCE